MAQTSLSKSSFGTISDISLDGFVTGLHVVQNTRTKQRFIVGGADDGSVAFWNQEQVFEFLRVTGADNFSQLPRMLCSLGDIYHASHYRRSISRRNGWTPAWLRALRFTRWHHCGDCSRWVSIVGIFSFDVLMARSQSA